MGSRIGCAALALALGACAGRFGRAGGDGPDLRLDLPEEVRWETAGPREVALVLENAGRSPVQIPAPTPDRAHVAIFRGNEATPVCRARRPDVVPAPAPVTLAPGEQRVVYLLLDGCHVAPGVYRYEAWLDLSSPAGGARAGRVGPEHGRVVVRASRGIDFPASREAVAPPSHAQPPGAPPGADAGTGAAPSPGSPAPPAGTPWSIACMDAELRRRGLNAYGDPAGTTYPGGPPTLGWDVERRRRVLERYPDIGTKCELPP